MKMWKQWMALLMIFCLLMPGALAGSIDLTDDLDEEVGSVTESSAGEDYTISDNGDIILDDDDDLGGDVIFDDDGSTIEITDNEIDDTIDPISWTSTLTFPRTSSTSCSSAWIPARRRWMTACRMAMCRLSCPSTRTTARLS